MPTPLKSVLYASMALLVLLFTTGSRLVVSLAKATAKQTIGEAKSKPIKHQNANGSLEIVSLESANNTSNSAAIQLNKFFNDGYDASTTKPIYALKQHICLAFTKTQSQYFAFLRNNTLKILVTCIAPTNAP